MKLRSEPHAATRARERFGIEATPREIEELAELAKTSPVIRRSDHEGNDTEIRVCWWKGELMKVWLGVRSGMVVTVYPCGELEAARWERDAMLAAGRFERRAG